MDPHCSSANNARPFPDSGLAHFSITIETRVPVLDIRHFSISTVCRNDVRTNLARFALATRDHRDRFNFANFVIVHVNFPVKRIVNEERWLGSKGFGSMRISICICIFAYIQEVTCIFGEWGWTMMDKWCV